MVSGQSTCNILITAEIGCRVFSFIGIEFVQIIFTNFNVPNSPVRSPRPRWNRALREELHALDCEHRYEVQDLSTVLGCEKWLRDKICRKAKQEIFVQGGKKKVEETLSWKRKSNRMKNECRWSKEKKGWLIGGRSWIRKRKMVRRLAKIYFICSGKENKTGKQKRITQRKKMMD